MKKIYFLSLLGVSSLCVNAQNIKHNQPSPTPYLTPAQHNIDVPVQSPVQLQNHSNHPIPNRGFGKTGTAAVNQLVGTTYLLNQTNNSPYRRVQAYPDGQVSLTWMTSTDNGANGYRTRGSGYNHYDGTRWLNVNGTRIEPYRAGFPCFVVSPDHKEIIISHNVDTMGLSKGLIINENNGLGNTTWTQSQFLTKPTGTPTPLWPRAAVSGHYLIVIAAYQDSTQAQPDYTIKAGIRSPIIWSRYDFNTSNWDVQDQTLPDYDSSITIGNLPDDNYSIDANGNNVAILIGDMFNSLVLWKSSDNGTNWTRTIIDSFPIPGYRFDQDSLPQTSVNNGSVHVLVDNNGKAHVFTGTAVVSDSILGDGRFTYYSAAGVGGVNDGIMYWNEYNPDSLTRIASTPLAADGTQAIIHDASVFTTISNATWPSAGIDSAGTIYLVFSGLTPGDNTSTATYRDIYALYSSDLGDSWSSPVNITNGNDWLGTGIEETMPTCAKNVTDKLHLTYLYKDLPGVDADPGASDPYGIFYLGMPTSQIINGTVGVSEIGNAPFSIDQNFPNPFSGTTSIPVNFKRNTSAKVSIVDIMGRTIYNHTFTDLPSGRSTLDIQLGKVPSGIYFYSVEADGFKTTRRMSVE